MNNCDSEIKPIVLGNGSVSIKAGFAGSACSNWNYAKGIPSI